MRSMPALFLAFSILSTAACTVGPDYKRPLVTLPDGYRGAAAVSGSPAGASSIGDEKWFDVFEDDQLRSLITTAVRQNFDVRIAAARVLQAQAQSGIVRADQFPTVQGGINSSRDRQPDSLRSAAVETGALQVGVAAAWELDFWGKFRRATEAARAEVLASQWGRRAVLTSLVGQVAGAYFQLRALDLDLDIATRTVASRRESLRLTELRAQGGATSVVDVRQAEQLVFGATAEIADLERQIEQQENFISTLLGTMPGSVPRGRSLELFPAACAASAPRSGGLGDASAGEPPEWAAAEGADVSGAARGGESFADAGARPRPAPP